MADIKSIATATAPREFELSYSTTVEEVYEKLSARASAFKMPFKIKEGIPGKRISFEKEPNLDTSMLRFGFLSRTTIKSRSWQTFRRTKRPSTVCALTKTA